MRCDCHYPLRLLTLPRGKASLTRGNLVVVMFSVAVLPTGFMESQSYFNCGPRQAQFHPKVIAVFPLNDAKKRKNESKKPTHVALSKSRYGSL